MPGDTLPIQVVGLVRSRKAFSPVRRRRLALLVLAMTSAVAWADPTTPNILPAGSFDDAIPTYVPWAGVDAENNIHGIDGEQIRVGDDGNIRRASFGPSVAVGDLNGDGKNDLIVADSWGYFWYFANTGTPQVPAFTQGEVIPIWLGEEATVDNNEGIDNVVPRIQLLDFEGSKKLDIVAGNYAGKLFHIPNIGSTEEPNFRPTQDRDRLMIKTRKGGLLWCNYLAPFFTTAFNTNNILDLVMGEGTYSANSIWLLHNTDTNSDPTFTEDHTRRIIPGMGLEDLTPNVVDWNNDGKPDVICGDRTGYLDLYLNNSTDLSNPTFAPPVHVSVGGQENFGQAITVTVCDLSNNHRPNLLIGRDDGTILYAINNGTPGNPQFTTPPLPLKGVLPPTYHYISPSLWRKDGAWGAPYEMVGCTNPQLEPGFTFPDGVKSKYALRFWVWPLAPTRFQRYYMPEETEYNQHSINCVQGVTLKMNTRYLLHFWVLAPGNSVTDFRYLLSDGGRPGKAWTPPGVSGDIPTSSSWTEVTRSFEISNEPDPSLKEYGYGFHFLFRGQEPFYIDDLQIQEDN